MNNSNKNEKEQKNVAISGGGRYYTVYLWDEDNTWDEVVKGQCQYIQIDFQEGYRASGYIKQQGQRMMMPLGEYDNINNPNKKYFDMGVRMINKEEKISPSNDRNGFTYSIEVNSMGNPVVVMTENQ